MKSKRSSGSAAKAPSSAARSAVTAPAKASCLPIERARLSDIVAARIRDYIVEHSLGEGDRLPTEHELTTLFGVSRGSLREATKALGFLGILRSAPKRGLTVGRVDMKRVTEYLGFHFSLNNYPRDQLLKTRLVIERGALEGVAEHMADDPVVYETLTSLNDRLNGLTDSDAFIRGDIAFHRALLEASGIEPLVAFGDLLGIFFLRFRQQVVESRATWSGGVRMHRELLNALRRGDLGKAERIMCEHMQVYREHARKDRPS
ncbi:MAG: FCD domain-containing protein [Kiritimatiellae bacterium]|nr:FCD domain-containing protein [Kiritimatiellia bacterium]